jgi:hypothetical protein
VSTRSDALTYAFADPQGAVCGVARLGLSDDGASGLVLVFRDGEVADVRADGDAEIAQRVEDVEAAGLRSETLEEDRRWQIAYAGEVALELEFEALADAVVLDAGAAAARAGGMEGFDHFCRVTGTVGGAAFEGLGQRGRSWGAPDWDTMSLARTVTAWFDDSHAVNAVAIRPVRAGSHADEAVSAFLLGEDGAAAVAEPRLSTTYDGEGRQRAAGLELYVGADDEYPVRVAGEVVAGTSLDLGRLRLDCAFFRWRMQGRAGVGRYDILRSA